MSGPKIDCKSAKEQRRDTTTIKYDSDILAYVTFRATVTI